MFLKRTEYAFTAVWLVRSYQPCHSTQSWNNTWQRCWHVGAAVRQCLHTLQVCFSLIFIVDRPERSIVNTHTKHLNTFMHTSLSLSFSVSFSFLFSLSCSFSPHTSMYGIMHTIIYMWTIYIFLLFVNVTVTCKCNMFVTVRPFSFSVQMKTTKNWESVNKTWTRPKKYWQVNNGHWVPLVFFFPTAAKVTDLRVTNLNSRRIRIAWRGVAGATGYRITWRQGTSKLLYVEWVCLSLINEWPSSSIVSIHGDAGSRLRPGLIKIRTMKSKLLI